MPIYKDKDSNGKFYQYGNTGKKYYFSNKKQQNIALKKAIRQLIAIEINRKHK
jgi:hypothetical protein